MLKEGAGGGIRARDFEMPQEARNNRVYPMSLAP